MSLLRLVELLFEKDWLAAWNELHFAMKKGTRLNRVEAAIVDKIAAIYGWFRRDPSG